MEEHIGFQLKRKRKELGLSVPALGLAMDIPPDRIYKWEKGTQPSDPVDYNKILNFLESGLETVPRETGKAEDPKPSYLEQRREVKNHTNEEAEGITYIPIEAQAGYSRRIIDPMFKSSLQKIFIPGMPYRGENYRIWEVEGNSMEPTFKEGFHLLSEKVEQESWKRIKEFHAYVIVTEDDVLLKRIAKSKKTKDHWVLHSDNPLYPEFLLAMELVKELWFVRRKMDWEMSPPKKFESDL